MARRAYGSDATMSIARCVDYVTPATSDFYKMAFSSTSLSAEQGLIDDPVLGYGRHPQEPSDDILVDDGDIVVPVDPRLFGLWLVGLLGEPTTTDNKASGRITFPGQPANLSTITLNGVVFTFVSGSPSGNQIQIGANLGATLDAAVTALNASVVAGIAVATYAHPATTSYLTIEHDTAGAAGNAYALAASAATPSAATLVGGGKRHRFISGADSDELGIFRIQVGHPKLPKYLVHEFVKINSMALSFARTGVPLATFGVMAQSETPYNADQSGTPTELTFKRMSQFQGYIKSAGERIANLTAATFNYTNNCEKINEIREDNKIGGVDATVPGISGQLTARYTGADLQSLAEGGTAVDLELGYRLAPNLSLSVQLSKVKLQKPKRPISGPGGVEVTMQYMAFQDPDTEVDMIVDLINDLDGTDYVL